MSTPESQLLLPCEASNRSQAPMPKSFTVRAVFAGCVIGILINLSNTYYGLIAGSSQQMPIVSALLGFFLFKSLSKFGIEPLSKAENVLIASTATATGCMPVTAGFADLIPALEYVLGREDGGPFYIPISRKVLWSLGLCFFGILFAAMLRTKMVKPSDMPWPGATASSNVIQTLYIQKEDPLSFSRRSDGLEQSYEGVYVIFKSAGIAMTMTIVILLFPILRNIPILGSSLARNWLWSLTLSPGFFGGGMIMGPEITLHMLAGAIVGWGVLSPYVKHKGWVSGPIDDWDTGSRGWTVWISVSVLVADAFVKISWICLQPLWAAWRNTTKDFARREVNSSHDGDHSRTGSSVYSRLPHEIDDPGSDRDQPLSNQGYSSSITRPRLVYSLMFLASVGFCMFTTTTVFGEHFPFHYVLLSVLLALPMAVVSIRTLGESDYNPQTGIVSQLFFAFIAKGSRPDAVVVNIVASAIATAGASQTGDLAYDFKIGQLVGAPPQSQMYGQVIGSVFGAIVSAATYKLYTTRFEIPGPFLQIPSSFLSISTAKLMLGRGLPEGAPCFALGFAVVFFILTIIKTVYAGHFWQRFIPSGVSFAVGIMLLPAYTLSRTAGGLFTAFWILMLPSKRSSIEVIGSGLILGESIASLADLVFVALDVPRFGPH